MADLTKAQKEDYRRFYNKKLPNGFSEDGLAAWNHSVVEQTIKDYEKMRVSEEKKRIAGYGERSDAVVSYLKALDRGGWSKNGADHSLISYFGKRELARLRGMEIRQHLLNRVKNATQKS